MRHDVDTCAHLSSLQHDLGSALRLANLYSYALRHDKAHSQFKHVLAHAPTSPAALYGRALAFYRQARWNESRDLLLEWCVGMGCDGMRCDGMGCDAMGCDVL